MEKSKHSSGLKRKPRQVSTTASFRKFNALVKGHRKLLEAMGKL